MTKGQAIAVMILHAQSEGHVVGKQDLDDLHAHFTGKELSASAARVLDNLYQHYEARFRGINHRKNESKI